MKPLDRRWGLLVALLALVLAGACTTVPGDRADVPEADEPPAPVVESVTTPGDAPPSDVSDALLPPLDLEPATDVETREPRFDIAVKDTPARDFFMGLVEDTPHSIVVDPSVAGTISLTLKNARVVDVMDAVRDVYGYEYRRTDYGFHVLPRGLKSQIFRIDYLHVARLGSSQTRVSSGQVSEGQRSLKRQDGLVEAERAPTSISGSRVETRSKVDFWRELVRALEAIVGDGEGREIVASPHTGVVVVRANPGELREVSSFLEKVRASIRRQVVLEAKILEVELSDGYQTGINWAYLANEDPDVLIGQTGGGSSIEDGVSEIAGNTGILDPLMAALPEGTATSAFGGVFTAAIEGTDFTAFIELLQTQGNVHTLSSPRVSTLNNQKAVIKVGSDEFFVTDISTTTVTGAATTTSPDITLTPFFSGIALDVTPQVGESGWITLHIHPSISDVQDQLKRISIGEDADFSLPLALSTIRESDSVVRARSGQVVVIGGLMQRDERYDDAGIPYLDRIPWLGRLFRHEREDKRKVELVILLRPTVVDEGTWGTVLDATGERLQELRPGSEESLHLGWTD